MSTLTITSDFSIVDQFSASPTDGSLVRKTLEGDCSAFDELIVRHQRQAIAIAYRVLGNANDALEVAQDAFLKAFTRLPMLTKAEAFGGWLMRIVCNLSLNSRRGRKSRAVVSLGDFLFSNCDQAAAFELTSAAGFTNPLRRLESEELGQRVRMAMGQLSEKQRTAIMLFAIEQMPQKQVAEQLGCSVEAVKWHVFQGRKRLKEVLKDYLAN